VWLSSELVGMFEISKDTVTALREEVAALRVERDALQTQLSKSDIFSDWLRMQVNTLQLERTGLMEKAYGIKLPAPEILRQPNTDPTFNPKDFSFEDVGEDLARKYGMPAYIDKQ
jgi:hypothetical protein